MAWASSSAASENVKTNSPAAATGRPTPRPDSGKPLLANQCSRIRSLRRRRESVERAAVEDGDDGEGGERVAAGVVEREPELEPDPGREDEDGRRGDRARADDERGRGCAARPEQEGQRVVRLDVVHLPDEEQGGAEEEDAEQVERLADPRPVARALAQVVGGRVRACDGCGEQSEPDAMAHPVPVRGDEADHAEPDRDRADHGERRRRAAAPLPPGRRRICGGSPSACSAETSPSATHASVSRLRCPANERSAIYSAVGVWGRAR